MESITDGLTRLNSAYFNTSNVIFREWLNGSSFPIALCLTVILAWTLAETWWHHGRGWSRLQGVSTLCALLWIFLSELIRSGLVWTTFWFENDGLSSSFLDPYRQIGLTVAGVSFLFGSFRLIKVITPRCLGHWGWIATVVITIVFLVGTHLI